MARELNPELFGPVKNQSEAPLMRAEIPDQYKKKIRDLEIQVHSLSQKIDKLAMLFEQKMIQTQHGQKSLETNVKAAVLELSNRQTAFGSKITERRMADAKIQELVDRHNQIVQNFEQRMSQVQKVASEQELKLMSYQATMEELLREIRAFKRS